MPPLLRHALIGLLVVAAQWLILGRLSLWGATPDAVLLFVAWLGLRYGRRYGAVGGFILGMLMDAIYGTWGIYMFVKTGLGFVMGLFPARERETLIIRPQQAFFGSLAIALVHNGVAVILIALQASAGNTFMAASLWLGASLYTALLGTLVSLFNPSGALR